MQPKEMVQALLDGGLCKTWDEAVHFLADCGEIDSVDHADLLTPSEYQRVYGNGPVTDMNQDEE